MPVAAVSAVEFLAAVFAGAYYACKRIRSRAAGRAPPKSIHVVRSRTGRFTALPASARPPPRRWRGQAFKRARPIWRCLRYWKNSL